MAKKSRGCLPIIALFALLPLVDSGHQCLAFLLALAILGIL